LYRAANKFKIRRPSLKSVLAGVIRSWKPDIIHTLGLDSASFLYEETRRLFQAQSGVWVVQVRGGPDLDLNRHLQSHARNIQNVLGACDQLIADNEQNYEILRSMGVPESRLAPLGVVPGTGGIDVKALSTRWSGLPSQRSRVIVCPKTYEAPSSKILPVFEAIRLAWPRLRPCRIYLLWAIQPEIYSWFAKLPDEIRDSCTLLKHIPRDEALDLFLQARVVLAPSLTDGIPNSMLEAMACGAFPIVSPIDTLRPLLQSPTNTIFARNLYPDEIGGALERALNDDGLVDAAARKNLEFVGRQANRDFIRPHVIRYYATLATRTPCQQSPANDRPGCSGQTPAKLVSETRAA
jgi:glycosyltransferase involved in cell wall biosynthesis